MASNAIRGSMSPYGSQESVCSVNATDGLDCSPNEPTGQSTKREALLEEQIRLMRDQLEMLQSRVLELERNARVGQLGAAEKKTEILQHEEDSSPVSTTEEEKADDPLTADLDPDHRKLDNQELDDQGLDDKVSQDQDGVDVKFVRIIPRLRRVEWSEFKNLYSNEKPLHAIDVLMGPARYYWQRNSEEKKANHNSDSFKYKVAREASYWREFDRKLAQVPDAVPERIRINSESILSIMNEISIESVPTDRPQVFLQPYKLIVALDAKIRQRLQDLESKWANYPETSSKAALHTSNNGSTAPGTSREAFVDGKREHSPKDPTNSLDALQDLRCLVEFMDNDIMPVWRMYRSGPDFYKQIT